MPGYILHTLLDNVDPFCSTSIQWLRQKLHTQGQWWETMITSFVCVIKVANQRLKSSKMKNTGTVPNLNVVYVCYWFFKA